MSIKNQKWIIYLISISCGGAPAIADDEFLLNGKPCNILCQQWMGVHPDPPTPTPTPVAVPDISKTPRYATAKSLHDFHPHSHHRLASSETRDVHEKFSVYQAASQRRSLRRGTRLTAQDRGNVAIDAYSDFVAPSRDSERNALLPNPTPIPAPLSDTSEIEVDERTVSTPSADERLAASLRGNASRFVPIASSAPDKFPTPERSPSPSRIASIESVKTAVAPKSLPVPIDDPTKTTSSKDPDTTTPSLAVPLGIVIMLFVILIFVVLIAAKRQSSRIFGSSVHIS